MKPLERIAFYLLPLSTQFSGLTIIPNRILIVLFLSIILVRNKFFISTLAKNKALILFAILYVVFILFSNNFLSKEAILFLTIPIYFILYRYSNLKEFLLKKYFILAVFTYSIILISLKLFRIVSFGFSNFFNQEQWWNQILYKNLSEELNGHPTYIAMFIVSSIILLLDQGNQSKKYFTPVQNVLILSTSLLVLLLLVVKISYLAMVVILVAYIVAIYRREKIKQALFYALFLVMAAIVIFNIPGIKQRLTSNFTSSKSSVALNEGQNRLNERTALWKSSLNYILDHPFYGTSFKGVSSKSSIYPLAKTLYPPLEFEKNCHNNYLEFGVRYGVFGTGLFLVFIFYLFMIGIKEGSFEIIGISILFCFFSLTESYMFREQGISFVAIIIAILRKQAYGKNI